MKLALLALAACSTPKHHEGELVVKAKDGRVLRSAQLVGATLGVGDRSVRIDRVTSETHGDTTLWLHQLRVVAADGSMSELCNADSAGERWAIVVNGRDIVCTSGAAGKCIRWGYTPRTGLHEACTRMARADYGGDGATATRDGTTIAFCDRAGVHPCRDVPRLEAAWSAKGATCVGYPRIPALASLDALAARYPRLAGHVGDACTLDRAGDAKLFSWRP